MAIKIYRPITPSLRYRAVPAGDGITSKKAKPEKTLLVSLKKTGGRNNYGNITSRRRGGGHKRMYRMIDFKRNKVDIAAKVARIEYDPNRSARIALLHYHDGEKRYILAPLGLKAGDTVMAGERAEIRLGNHMPLARLPLGTLVHNVELRQGKGGQIVRAAGAAAQVMAKEGGFAHLKLPSGEIRRVRLACSATIGQVGNLDHESIVLGKAGASRWQGRRPKVRGVAMNPVDHPLGGGEGKSAGGRHPSTPWGKPTKGYKTRSAKKTSDIFIVRRRNES